MSSPPHLSANFWASIDPQLWPRRKKGTSVAVPRTALVTAWSESMAPSVPRGSEVAETPGRRRGCAVGSLVVRGDGAPGGAHDAGEAVVAQRVFPEAVGDVDQAADRTVGAPAVHRHGDPVVVDDRERLGHRGSVRDARGG